MLYVLTEFFRLINSRDSYQKTNSSIRRQCPLLAQARRPWSQDYVVQLHPVIDTWLIAAR